MLIITILRLIIFMTRLVYICFIPRERVDELCILLR